MAGVERTPLPKGERENTPGIAVWSAVHATFPNILTYWMGLTTSNKTRKPLYIVSTRSKAETTFAMRFWLYVTF